MTNFTATGIYRPVDIVAGPDGALWFTNEGYSIGRIATGGAVTIYPVPDSPSIITVGPDGALWFTGNGSIGRITASGTVTTYRISGSQLSSIATGPDGALWFTNIEGNSIGRITTSGVVTNNYTATGIKGPFFITTGPDGALWFTNAGGNSIGRITTDGEVTSTKRPASSSHSGSRAVPTERFGSRTAMAVSDVSRPAARYPSIPIRASTFPCRQPQVPTTRSGLPTKPPARSDESQRMESRPTSTIRALMGQ